MLIEVGDALLLEVGDLLLDLGEGRGSSISLVRSNLAK